MLGARPPQLVALRVPAGPAMAHAVEQIWDGGDAVLPLPLSLPDAAVTRLLRDLRPAVVVEATGRVRLPDAVPVAPDVALVVATSGSSGRAKGVELTYGALQHAAAATHARLDVAVGDRWLCCLPLHHVAGFQMLVRSQLLDNLPVFTPPEPSAISAATDATLISLVPTMLVRLLDAGVDLSRFRRVLLGGAAPGEALLARARQAGVPVVTSYGMTETAGGCVYDGRPLDGVEVALLPGNRIALRGPMLMRGYRLRDDLTAAALEDGWFHTADRGELLPDGTLRVTGRVDTVINTGGEKVDPAEVAAVLRAHPGIADIAVVGLDDAEWGQRVTAVCVAADPRQPPGLADLRAFGGRHLAGFQLPRELLVVREIPRTALGKVDAGALTAQLSGSGSGRGV
jgi:o-succinylbenzoate---CoA ligase